MTAMLEASVDVEMGPGIWPWGLARSTPRRQVVSMDVASPACGQHPEEDSQEHLCLGERVGRGLHLHAEEPKLKYCIKKQERFSYTNPCR